MVACDTYIRGWLCRRRSADAPGLTNAGIATPRGNPIGLERMVRTAKSGQDLGSGCIVRAVVQVHSAPPVV
jgi:hypothetical protein